MVSESGNDIDSPSKDGGMQISFLVRRTLGLETTYVISGWIRNKLSSPKPR